MVTIYPVPVLSSNISRLDPWYSLSTLHAMCFDGIDFLQTPRRIGPCVKYSPTAYQIELLPARALNKPSVHPRISSVFDYSFQGCSMRILSSSVPDCWVVHVGWRFSGKRVSRTDESQLVRHEEISSCPIVLTEPPLRLDYA